MMSISIQEQKGLSVLTKCAPSRRFSKMYCEASGLGGIAYSSTTWKIKHCKQEEVTNIVERSFRFCLKDFYS